jgi:hypothetical protein
MCIRASLEPEWEPYLARRNGKKRRGSAGNGHRSAGHPSGNGHRA